MHTIEKIISFVKVMNKEQLELIFTKKAFNTMNKLMKEGRFAIEILLPLLKHVGKQTTICNCDAYPYPFSDSQLDKSFEQIIRKMKRSKKKKLTTTKPATVKPPTQSELIPSVVPFHLLCAGSTIHSSLVLAVTLPCLLNEADVKDKTENWKERSEEALIGLQNMEIFGLFCFIRSIDRTVIYSFFLSFIHFSSKPFFIFQIKNLFCAIWA